MKAKVSSFLSLGFGLLLVAGLVGGCGKVMETLETKTYYFPNWTPDGKIIAVKHVVRQTKGAWGNYDTTYDKTMMTTMSSDGTNEVDLFEILGYNDFLKAWASDFDREIVCSPDGKKIGYVSSPDSKIIICNYDGTGKAPIPGISGVKYFDWSPDSSKIAYSANQKLHIVNIDGTNDSQILDSAESVAWRVGDKIVYEGIVNGGSYIFSANKDGSNNSQIIAGSDPQKSSDDVIIYSGTANVIKSIYTSGTSEATISNTFNKASLKLSFDNMEIVGGNLDQQDIIGIWVINTDGSGEKRLR